MIIIVADSFVAYCQFIRPIAVHIVRVLPDNCYRRLLLAGPLGGEGDVLLDLIGIIQDIGLVIGTRLPAGELVSLLTAVDAPRDCDLRTAQQLVGLLLRRI